MIRIFAKEIDLEIPLQLRGLVLAFILGETHEEIQARIPVLPTGFPLLINTFGSVPEMIVDGENLCAKSRTVLAGQIVNVKIHGKLDGIYGQVGVVLHPMAPYYLFHVNGEDYTNTWTPFEEISPVCATQLVKHLSGRSLSKKVRIKQILKFLVLLEKQRLPGINWLDRSLVEIFSKNGKIDQQELLQNSGICARHFRRVFRKIVGVAPKYFCKVIQMNTAFEALNSSDPEKLHHIALDCGYYDQSHFINDFNRMFGVSPEKFLNGKYSFIKHFMGRRGT